MQPSSESGEEKLVFIVSDADRGIRLDLFLTGQPYLKKNSRSFLQALTRQGDVLVNGKIARAANRLHAGDRVEVNLPPAVETVLEPEPVSFTVLYEDDDILVLYKPAGLVVHPAAGHRSGTLVHGLLHRCSKLSGINGELRPGIVHRLDQDTSGVMVVAKNDLAHRSLVRQFADRKVRKMYVAVVHGVPQTEQGRINAPVGRHPVQRKKMAVTPTSGREAVTDWKLLEKFGDSFSFLELRPHTGRTHQIRVHLAHLHCPIVNDPVYGRKKHDPLLPADKRLCLHAKSLSFIHPTTGEALTFAAAIPEDMEEVLRQLRMKFPQRA